MAKATEARAQQYEDALWYLLGLQEVQAVLSQKLRGGPDIRLPAAPASRLALKERGEWWSKHPIATLGDLLSYRESCVLLSEARNFTLEEEPQQSSKPLHDVLPSGSSMMYRPPEPVPPPELGHEHLRPADTSPHIAEHAIPIQSEESRPWESINPYPPTIPDPLPAIRPIPSPHLESAVSQSPFSSSLSQQAYAGPRPQPGSEQIRTFPTSDPHMFVPVPVPSPASLQQNPSGPRSNDASTLPVSDLFW
ncbi:hypothetical protein JCM24511_04751 [Saitozyma sp. JCM 24511]|nr:hypothetical protein JCM24511_04751 [Saitozyma sp. JCM 24511]